MIQVYQIKDRDQGIKKFQTDDGHTIRLELIAEEGRFLLRFRSRGKYMVRIGYTHGIYLEDDEPIIAGKYRIQEEIMTNSHDMCIWTNDYSTVFLPNEIDPVANSLGYVSVSDIDIISISNVTD